MSFVQWMEPLASLISTMDDKNGFSMKLVVRSKTNIFPVRPNVNQFWDWPYFSDSILNNTENKQDNLATCPRKYLFLKCKTGNQLEELIKTNRLFITSCFQALPSIHPPIQSYYVISSAQTLSIPYLKKLTLQSPSRGPQPYKHALLIHPFWEHLPYCRRSNQLSSACSTGFQGISNGFQDEWVQLKLEVKNCSHCSVSSGKILALYPLHSQNRMHEHLFCLLASKCLRVQQNLAWGSLSL